MPRTLAAFSVGFALLVTGGVSAGRQELGPWSPPVNLGPVINYAQNDSGPAISRDGLSLYFHSHRSGPPSNLDLFVARRAAVDLPWEAPIDLGDVLNTPFPDAGPVLSKNGHHLFFGSTRGGTFDVYMSRRRHTHDDLAWEPPVLLPAPVNGGSFDVPHDYTEHGGRRLYMGSDRTGGGGTPGLDIYVTELQGDGTWSEPVFVTELNSPFQDARPTVRADGLEVIFNSARDGNLDLYVSRRRHHLDPWSIPENLGPTLNSPSGDIQPALSADGTTLYFASDRSGGFGSFDLYVSTRSVR